MIIRFIWHAEFRHGFIELFASFNLRKFENGFADTIWVRDLFKNETCFFTGCLDFYVAKVKQGFCNAFDRACDVLHAVETELGNGTGKETGLLDVEDALVGNDPDIQIVVHEILEQEQPGKEEKRRAAENNEGHHHGICNELWLVHG